MFTRSSFAAILIIVSLAILSVHCSPLTETSSSNVLAERVVQITDSQGRVVFDDHSTGEDVTITLVENGVAVIGADVAYMHGDSYTYEAFLARDSRGLIAADFFLHNSDHQLEVIRGEIRPYNAEQAEALEGYATDMALVSRNTYIETIPERELNRRMENLSIYTDVLLFFLGKFPGTGQVVSFLGELGNFVDGMPKEYDEETSWDMYESYDAQWGYTTFVFVESQRPLMQSPTVSQGTNNHAFLSFLAIDPIRYPSNSTTSPGIPDQTILFGDTEYSDLTYHFEVYDSEEHLLMADSVDQESVCIQDNCSRTEVDLGVLPAGSYTLFIQAQDEVGNFSLPNEFTFFYQGEGASQVSPAYHNALDASVDLVDIIESGNLDSLRRFVGPNGVAITDYFYHWNPPGFNNADEVVDLFEELTTLQDPTCEFITEGTLPEDHYFIIISGMDLDSVFGEYWEDALLVIDLRTDDEQNFIIAAVGPFTLRDVNDSLPGVRLSCDGGENTSSTPSLEDFAEQVRMGAETGSTSYLADPVYVYSEGIAAPETLLQSLNGYVAPEDARDYISLCLEVLEDIAQYHGMSHYGFNPIPIDDPHLLEESSVANTEFFFEWGMDDGNTRAYARLILGVSRIEDVFMVTVAHCYPYVQ
jgi:hypothetical protein